MAQATTLSQYYQSQGQNLPSVQQRQGLAAQAGIQGYSGTAAQNTQLLGYLQQNGLGGTATGNNLNISTPPTIPIQTGTGNVQPINLPNTPVSNIPNQLTGQAGASIQPIQAQPVQNQYKPTGNYKQDFLGLIDSISARPGELAKEYNIQALQADFNKAKAGYDATELAYRRQEEAATTNPALSADAKQARLSEIGRKKASQLADIAIDYNLKQGLYSNAKELMNQQLQMELEPMKLKADFYKDMYMKTQDQAFQREMKRADREYQTGLAAGQLDNAAKLAGLNPKVLSTPDYKTIGALAPAIKAIHDYNNAIKQWGTFENISAQGKGELKSAYGDAIAAWKTLAGLGALSGADFGLAENVIPSPSLFTRNKKSLSQLEGAISRAQFNANNLASNLKLAYPDSAGGLDLIVGMALNGGEESNDPLGLGITEIVNSNPLGI